LVASKSISVGTEFNPCDTELPNYRILLKKWQPLAAITSMGGDGRTLFAQCRQDEPIVKFVLFLWLGRQLRRFLLRTILWRLFVFIQIIGPFDPSREQKNPHSAGRINRHFPFITRTKQLENGI
jgi:hypothetical protein